MKNIKKNILQALTLSALVIIIVACSSRWDSYYAETENTSAYDLLKAQADFSEFLKLIEQNQLDYLLKDGVVTVFAPANGTFNTTGLSEIDLKNLLRQHIASGRVTASNASGTSYFASNGAFLIFDASFAKVNGVSISLQGTQKSGSIVHKVASLMNSSSKETLYGYLRKNKALYGYLYSLFDAATFDEKASVKYSGINGKLTYDSVFLAKSQVLDPYLISSDFNTVIIFTDKQFDDAMAKFPAAAVTAILATPTIKKGFIARTFIQSIFKGLKSFPVGSANWVAVNGSTQVISSSKLSSAFDVFQNTTVLKFNDLSSNLGTDYFNLLIQTDAYTLGGVEGASGGANAHEIVSVPVFAKGNGFARRIYPNSTSGNSHAYFVIGGDQKGTFVPALNGVNYIVRMCVSLTSSIKCILWVYDQGTADKRLYLDADANFDISKNFICNTLNGGMRVVEFPAQPLYTRVLYNAPTFKFHTDYRNLTLAAFPPINGVAPTLQQSGIVIDYIEFVPVLN
jgi:hypothetical protein